MVSIKVDASEIDKFAVVLKNYPSKTYQKVAQAVSKSTHNVKANAKQNITKNGNVDTGHLRNSVIARVSSLEGTVSNNVKYARTIEEGSKAHIIRPRTKKMLYWNGAAHPVRQVNHPGTKPYPFMKPALEKEMPNFMKELQDAVKFEES